MAYDRSKPRKPADKVLGTRLELRITAPERKAYEQAAKKAGLSVSEWIRDLLSKATGRDAKG